MVNVLSNNKKGIQAATLIPGRVLVCLDKTQVGGAEELLKNKEAMELLAGIVVTTPKITHIRRSAIENIPGDDNTLQLVINAGMETELKFLLGAEAPTSRQVAEGAPFTTSVTEGLDTAIASNKMAAEKITRMMNILDSARKELRACNERLEGERTLAAKSDNESDLYVLFGA